MYFRTKPSIPEMDFSGTAVAVGKGVNVSRELVPGAKTFGSVPMGQHLTSGKGALAQYVVVPAEHVVLKPENVGVWGGGWVADCGYYCFVCYGFGEGERWNEGLG